MTTTYDSLDELKGREAIRRVPGMYISSLGHAGYAHMLNEVLDNSVDEALGGHCTHIDITLGADGSVTVSDNGRGIPIKNNDEGVSFLVKAFSIHSGGKFLKTDGTSAYKQSGGLHGVGIAIVAALSDRADCTVYRDGKETTVSFQRGDYGVFKGAGVDAPFTPKPDTFVSRRKDSRSEAQVAKRPTGTTMRFWLDHAFMDVDTDEVDNVVPATIDREMLIERIEDTTYLVPGLAIRLRDQRGGDDYDRTFHNPGGVKAMLDDLATAKLLCEPIIFSGTTTYATRGETKDFSVDIALAWENSNQLHRKTFTNIIRTRSGGTHENGFLKGLEKVVLEQVERLGARKSKDPMPTIEDMSEGLVFVVSASLPRPAYSGQTKERLTEAPVLTAVRNIVDENLSAWFTKRANASAARAIAEKIISAARSRAARDAKFSIKDVVAEADKESVLGRKPVNLKDCVKHGAGKGSELFIVEGISALGSLLKARDSQFQALYPLRGKPLNMYEMTPEKMFIPPMITAPKTEADKRKMAQRKKFTDDGHILLQNREMDDLVKIIGAGFGSEFDVSKRQFDRICIAVDADVDGSHIAALLCVFFYKFMRPLVTGGHLFITQPPLYVIKHGKQSAPGVSYALNAMERDDIIADLRSTRTRVLDIGRRKGLGESPEEEMRDMLMNPKTRTLKRVTLGDAQAAAALFEVLFSKDTQARKDWIASEHVSQLLRA